MDQLWGPIIWTPHSPDLNPLAFFFSVCALKKKVNVTKVHDCNNLIYHILVAVISIRHQPRQLICVRNSNITMKHVSMLDEVTLSSSSEEMCKTVQVSITQQCHEVRNNFPQLHKSQKEKKSKETQTWPLSNTNWHWSQHNFLALWSHSHAAKVTP
jgi:hypothetical protein